MYNYNSDSSRDEVSEIYDLSHLNTTSDEARGLSQRQASGN